MKNSLTKILFISLLSSAVIPSGVQAGLFTSAGANLTEAWNNSADFRTRARGLTVDFLKQVGEKAGEVWSNSANLRDVVKKRPGFLLVFGGVIYALWLQKAKLRDAVRKEPRIFIVSGVVIDVLWQLKLKLERWFKERKKRDIPHDSRPIDLAG